MSLCIMYSSIILLLFTFLLIITYTARRRHSRRIIRGSLVGNSAAKGSTVPDRKSLHPADRKYLPGTFRRPKKRQGVFTHIRPAGKYVFIFPEEKNHFSSNHSDKNKSGTAVKLFPAIPCKGDRQGLSPADEFKIAGSISLPAKQSPSCKDRLRNFRLAVITFIMSLLTLCGIMPQYALAQIGTGFVDNGYDNGTIGSRKGRAKPYRRPRGSVSQGYRHTDKGMDSTSSGCVQDMTSQVAIYCTVISLDANSTPKSNPVTLNEAPTVLRHAYPQPGTTKTNYCPDIISAEMLCELFKWSL